MENKWEVTEPILYNSLAELGEPRCKVHMLLKLAEPGFSLQPYARLRERRQDGYQMECLLQGLKLSETGCTFKACNPPCGLASASSGTHHCSTMRLGTLGTEDASPVDHSRRTPLSMPAGVPAASQ